MNRMKKIHTKSVNPENQPLSMSESVGTFIFSDEEIDLTIFEIGKNIQKYRMKYNLSIDRLADLAGITKGTLYKIESGSAKIGLVVLLKISFVLQVPIDDFVPFSYPNTKERKSLGEIIDSICFGIPKDSELFILNFVKNFVKYSCSCRCGHSCTKKKK